MKLVPWKARETGLDLFQDLEDFQLEMNRLFDFNLQREAAKMMKVKIK